MVPFIEERASALVNSYNSGNVDMMMNFVTKDLTFSDILMQKFHLDRDGMRSLLDELFTENDNIQFTTRCVTGSPEFVAHEMVIEFRTRGEVDGLDISVGQSIRMVGVSLQGWRKQQQDGRGDGNDVGAWKVFDQKDYFFIEKSDG